MIDAYDIQEHLQFLLHDTTARQWGPAKRLRAINAAYDQVCSKIIEEHDNWFYKEETLTAGTSTWERTEFALPSVPALMAKILLLTDTDGRTIDPIETVARQHAPVAPMARGLMTGYWLGHNSLYLNSEGYTSSLRLYYIRRPSRLITGTADSGTTSTLVMADDPAPDPRDDYYNDVRFYLRGGTGDGETAVASDYTGSGRTLTIDFTSTPSATSVYASGHELPEGHGEIVAYGAAIRCLHMDVAQKKKLESFEKWYTKLETDLVEFLEHRQVQKARSVHMRNLD